MASGVGDRCGQVVEDVPLVGQGRDDADGTEHPPVLVTSPFDQHRDARAQSSMTLASASAPVASSMVSRTGEGLRDFSGPTSNNSRKAAPRPRRTGRRRGGKRMCSARSSCSSTVSSPCGPAPRRWRWSSRPSSGAPGLRRAAGRSRWRSRQVHGHRDDGGGDEHDGLGDMRPDRDQKPDVVDHPDGGHQEERLPSAASGTWLTTGAAAPGSRPRSPVSG